MNHAGFLHGHCVHGTVHVAAILFAAILFAILSFLILPGCEKEEITAHPVCYKCVEMTITYNSITDHSELTQMEYERCDLTNEDIEKYVNNGYVSPIEWIGDNVWYRTWITCIKIDEDF